MEEPFNLRLIVIFGCFVSGGRGKGRRSGPSPVPLLLWRNGDLTLEQRHFSRSGSWETELFGETLSAIGIFKQALQITIDSIGTLENVVSWLSWIELSRTWETNPHLPLCCYTRLWIRRDCLAVHVTPLEIEGSGGISRISKVGIFNEDKSTQDNSDHQSGSNPNTQGDGWLNFFIKVYYNTTLVLLEWT